MNTIRGHSGEWVRKIASLDETHLALAYSSIGENLGKTIRILNWMTSGENGKLIVHARDVTALADLEDEYLVSSSTDAVIKIWNWQTQRLVENLTGHSSGVNDLLPIHNFSQIVSCSYDSGIKVWKRSNRNATTSLIGYSMIKTLVLLQNGYLAGGSGDGMIGVWNLTKEARILNISAHSAEIKSLLNLDKSRIASCAKDWKIKIWLSDLSRQIRTLLGHSNWVNSLVVLTNGHLASASADGTIRIWDLDKDSALVKTIFAHSKHILCLILLEDRNLASGSADTNTMIWHIDKNSTTYIGR
jgi:WD40 repeat protein